MSVIPNLLISLVCNFLPSIDPSITISMALRVAKEAVSKTSAVTQFYRKISQDLPRLLAIYDIEMPVRDARACIRKRFREHAAVKDPRVIAGLVVKGQMELEEAMMQWYTRSHVLPYFAYEKPDEKKDVVQAFFDDDMGDMEPDEVMEKFVC